MDSYPLIFSSLTILVGIGSILANLIIASRTIYANKQIAKENAGKNRIIYSIEIKAATEGNDASKNKINEMLNTGNYTVLASYQNIGNRSETIYTLGKITP